MQLYKHMPKYMMSVAMAAMLTACVQPATNSYYTQRQYTNPTYTIVENEGNIEVRDYKSLLVAEITENGDRATALRNGSTELDRYFRGKNATGEAIASTEPMVQFPVFRDAHTPQDIRSVDNHTWIVRFYLPVEFTRESVPQPKDPNIRILETNPMTVAAISFSGPWTDENIQDNENILKDYINNESLHASNVPAYAFYDPPAIAPVNRHNEVMMKLADY